MSSTLVHPMIFPEIGIAEQDHDPNTALLELDRALKSSNVGEQCEAISRFPNLFEKYPFPILINSALLKLSEVFRVETAGSYLVRVCVCEVLEASALHLDKLINVEEFLKRITTVMHSNDPIARALTLKALGLLSCVVGEVKTVQHHVRDSLNASDPLELQAAIAAAEKYAAVSKGFAVSMCERLTEMLSALSTPMEVKLQLIKVFQHMHHDAETAAQVRSVCLKLLERCPTQRLVITTLQALTQLAAHCLIHIPHQVDLLLSVVSRECRAGVRDAALKELTSLASTAPHAWTPGNVLALVNFTRSTRTQGNRATDLDQQLKGLRITTETNETTVAALDVLATLTSAHALPHLNLTPDCELHKLSKEFVHDSNHNIATTALQLNTNITLYMHEEEMQNKKKVPSEGTSKSSSPALVCSDALNAGVSLLSSLVYEKTEARSCDTLKVPLICCVLLARCDDTLSASLSNTLINLLTEGRRRGEEETTGVICEALASLGGTKRGVMASHIPALLGLLHSTNSSPPTSPQSTKLISTICSVIFQAYLGHAWDRRGLDSIMRASRTTDHWTSYRIARQAARYGHHQVAASIYQSLRSKVCSDQQYYWLTALHQVSKGEACAVAPIDYTADNKVVTDVVEDRATPLSSAANCLYSALCNLKACSDGQHPLVFVQRYISLRSASLSLHSQLTTTCQSMRTSPPPAIAATHVAAFRDEMVKCCRLVQQLNKLSQDFENLAQDYGKLYQSQFDADPQTLSNLSMLQRGAKLMTRAITILTKPMNEHGQYSSGGGSKSNATSSQSLPEVNKNCSTVQDQLMLKALREANKNIVELEKLCPQKKPIMECQLLLLTKISEMLTGVPLPYPRLFYQSLQHTNITLNVTPQPRTPGDPIVIQNSSQLVVKVEGVISHGRRPGIFRSIKSVTLHVNSQMISRLPQFGTNPLDTKTNEQTENLSQTVEPHNDFFSAQFLLAFPIPGQYGVTIDASVTDQSDETWQTGPRHSLAVKALEDPTTINKAMVNQQVLVGPSGISVNRPPPPNMISSPGIMGQHVNQMPMGSQSSSVQYQGSLPPGVPVMQYPPPPPNLQGGYSRL